MFDAPTTLIAEATAGGAEIAQIVIATVAVGGIYSALALLVLSHRRSDGDGRLGRLSDRVADLSGLPAWAALPIGLAAVSLIVALLGMYWDISLHIDNGRDDGPLANIAHYPILLGLMGIFASGWLAIFLPRKADRPGPAPLRLGEGWHAPIGGILVFLCGGFSLIAFPLDDLWHRIFGQDVTLWGPTHLMLLGGAAMTLVGQSVLLVEAFWTRRETGQDEGSPIARTLVRMRRIGLMGGLLIGVSVYQAEFDFGVPQFRAVFEPAMLALAAAFALTTARIWIGRGGALAAVAFFVVVRGAVSVFVGPVIGETTPMVPLYLAEAALIELLALAVGTSRPLRFGAIAGGLAGTAGFAAQWGLSHAYMPMPWREDILPEGLLMALAAGLAGGILGALLASGLEGRLPSRRIARTAYVGSMAVLVAVVLNGLREDRSPGAEATLQVTETAAGAERMGDVAVTFDPAGLPDDASWVNVTSWQGDGLEVNDLRRGDDGVWRTEEPVPLHGEWKSIVRVHRDDLLAGVPVFLPEDPAIPAPEVPAEPSVTREVTTDQEILQRELKDDVPGYLTTVASSLVGLMYLAFLTMLAWGVGRVGRAQGEGHEPEHAAEPARSGAARPRVA